ncbi:TIGR00341 family protein [Candidatus Falkowbacteria bacterium]|jgi:uncharacterized hydrophobic protein (TIGR00271 family)|nr:TIGR00341 family protein [Candidatus Falkowbacteria bacterium]MBT7007253.1 TIGR00341 family protein [Candidatus Falkowbacteria bacterium]
MKNKPSIASEDETNVFRKLKSSFRQTFKRQDKVYNQIRENAKPDFDFYVLTIFSGIIITLGILIDSSAVVIGGMLVAPFVWPILAIALGITMGRTGLIKKAVFTIFVSGILIVIISLLMSIILPEIVVANNQFLSRTSPTLLEFLVGLTAGFIGAFIIAYPNVGSAIAGVVIAAAIVPPLATIGISVSKMDWPSAGGAVLLFLSQLIAIVFAAAILFIISDFRYRNKQAEKKTKLGFSWTVMLLIVIVIPLYLSTIHSATQVKYQKIVSDVITTNFDHVKITELKFYESKETVKIELIINYDSELTQTDLASIKSVLEKRIGQPIDLSINVIPYLSSEKSSELDEQDLTDVIKKIAQETMNNENVGKYLKCRVFVNELKIERYYPVELGCPICPKIISCQDGSEYPVQVYNEEKGECDDINFVNQAPCFPQYDSSSTDNDLIEN